MPKAAITSGCRLRCIPLPIAALRHVINRCGAAKAVQHTEAHAVFVQNRSENAATDPVPDSIASFWLQGLVSFAPSDANR
jgi:hypothetical protein